MDLTRHFSNVCVLGAGGKMGRGIAYLLAEALAGLRQQQQEAISSARLCLIDPSSAALEGTVTYVEQYLRKAADKHAKKQQGTYPIDARIADVRRMIHTDTHLDACQKASLVFEAVPEKEDLKVNLLKDVSALSPKALCFSNTSSIPIGALAKQTDLLGRMVGFHFYNPPAVQPLVEVVIPNETSPEFHQLTHELGSLLGKVLVPAADVAGFIGNGHFIRDAKWALDRVDDLSATSELTAPAAVLALNEISTTWLLRPMGIFELLDYVGLDVVDSIAEVMTRYLGGRNLRHPKVGDLVGAAHRGGQYPDGGRREGFFGYEGGKMAKVYDSQAKAYVDLNKGLEDQVRNFLGDIPTTALPWKTLRKSESRDAQIAAHVQVIESGRSRGCVVAREYLDASRQIAFQLVEDGVAQTLEDVSQVLTLGFQHLIPICSSSTA